MHYGILAMGRKVSRDIINFQMTHFYRAPLLYKVLDEALSIYYLINLVGL